MSIVAMQVFVSLALVAGGLVLFLHAVRQHDFDHADRLSLAPLDDDFAPVTLPSHPSHTPSPPTSSTSTSSSRTEATSTCRPNTSNTTTP